MITIEQKQKLLSALRQCTSSYAEENQKYKLPIIISGEGSFVLSAEKDNIITESNGALDDKELIDFNNSLSNTNPEDLENIMFLKSANVVYGTKKCKLLNVSRFHYNDKWYSYKYSVDEPQFTFGIIKTSAMPYNSFEGRLNKKSFVSTAYSLIRQGYCKPFMLFINNKFVNLDYINVVFDCGDTYLLLYGEEYNFYNLKDAKIHMVILPFDIDYKGRESSMHFDMMCDVLKSYIQENIYITANNQLSNPKFDIDEVYEYRGMVYPIGGWIYNQLRKYHLGILEAEYVYKLNQIKIIKFNQNTDSSIISSCDVLNINLYNADIYNNFYCLSESELINQSIFRFNNEGKLQSNTRINMVSIVNPKIINVNSFIDSSRYIFHTENCNALLIKENYMVFKDGLFYPDCDIQIPANNIIVVDNPDEIKHEFIMFYYESLSNQSRMITHIDHFNKNYIASILLNYMNNTEDLSDVDLDRNTYLAMALEQLSFTENEDDMETVVKYDPTLLNQLYHTNIHSINLTGSKANEAITSVLSYEQRQGLKITRSGYENNESQILVFEDGELLKEYSNMLVYTNYFFIPMSRLFDANSQIEILYFNNINNVEVNCSLQRLLSISQEQYDKSIAGEYIGSNDLKVFCDYPENILEYKDLINPSDNISFNISYGDSTNVEIISSIQNNPSEYDNIIITSNKRFAYQRLYVTQKSYRILLGKQFKYCDNPNQYVLFINGRRMNDESFIVTIPKYTRPFWEMRLYVSKFVNPEDRIELFYLPYELKNINSNFDLKLNEDGYIITDKSKLDIPYDPRLYLLFINGKKISSNNIIAINSYAFRINKDTLSTNNLVINPIYIDTLSEVKEYLNDSNTYSDYDRIIDYILKSDNLGYSELDLLFNIFVKMSNTETDKIKQNVGRIAILNQIVRDFWITSGFSYNELPFVYDFETNEFTPKDGNNNVILPSMDATQLLNIIKNNLKLLYFYTNPENKYYEIGSVINNIGFFWEYALTEGDDLEVISQTLSHKPISGNNYTDIILSTEDREYHFPNNISVDTKFHFSANVNSQTIEKFVNVKFINGIYYGIVNEDILQYLQPNYVYEWIYNIVGLEPKNGRIPSEVEQQEEKIDYTALIYKETNNIIYDIEYQLIDNDDELSPLSTIIEKESHVNLKDITILSLSDNKSDNIRNVSLYTVSASTGLEECIVPQDLQHVMGTLESILQASPEIKLNDYIIGNNNYFVYACPERLAIDENGKELLKFTLPDINSDEVKNHYVDDKSWPIYTNGEYDYDNILISQPQMEMIPLGKFVYTNSNGYSETYCVWRTNGYFTRSFDDYKFSIEISYINKDKSYNDGLGNIIEA